MLFTHFIDGAWCDYPTGNSHARQLEGMMAASKLGRWESGKSTGKFPLLKHHYLSNRYLDKSSMSAQSLPETSVECAGTNSHCCSGKAHNFQYDHVTCRRERTSGWRTQTRWRPPLFSKRFDIWHKNGMNDTDDTCLNMVNSICEPYFTTMIINDKYVLAQDWSLPSLSSL